MLPKNVGIKAMVTLYDGFSILGCAPLDHCNVKFAISESKNVKGSRKGRKATKS